MEESTQAQSGNAGNQSEANNQNQDLQVNRSAEEYAKRLQEVAAEAKQYRQANADMKARLEAIEKEKLESQGKWQDLAKKEAEAREAAEQRLKATAGTFATRLVNKEIEAEAAKLGCVDTKALLKLVDLEQIEIDTENFEVDAKSVQRVLEQAAKEKPYLFQAKAPTPKDLPPGSGTQTFKDKPLKEMSVNEKLQKLAELTKRGA